MRTVAAVTVLLACSACASVAAAPQALERMAAPSSTLSLAVPATTTATSTTSTATTSTTTSTTTATTISTTSTATTSTTTSTPTTTTTTAPAPRSVTMAFTGDTLVHSPLWRGAQRLAAAEGREGYDFVPMLARLRPLLEPTDLAVCHLETPIAPLGEALSTAPRYGVPEEVADALVQAGYDRCSTASNHTLDRGTAGVVRTVDVLESRGLGQSGMARTPEEIQPKVIDVAGVAVSHLSYTFSYNGLLPPSGEEWRSALIDPGRILADAAAARAAGAEVVVVSLHWGAEKVHAPTQEQRSIADALTASGLVDLIVGHHAHVVQPIAQVNGHWVVYGLGNVLSNHPTGPSWPAASQDAMVVTVAMTVAADGTVTVERPVVHPTWVDREANWIVRPVLEELAQPDLPPADRARLEQSLARTAAVVGGFIPAP